MSQIIRLAIADDHKLIIDGLSLLLDSVKDLQIVHTSTNVEEMFQKIKHLPVDLLLTDIIMPGPKNGYDLALAIHREFPQIKIIALSMSEEGLLISKMIDDAGVDGYIPKTIGREELILAIKQVMKGEKYFGKDVLNQYNKFHAQIAKSNEILSPREIDIVKCILKHYSNKQIAEELYISERTVETHRKNIYRKTNTKGESSLVQYIKDHRLVV